MTPPVPFLRWWNSWYLCVYENVWTTVMKPGENNPSLFILQCKKHPVCPWSKYPRWRKTVQVVFKYLSKSLLWKAVGDVITPLSHCHRISQLIRRINISFKDDVTIILFLGVSFMDLSVFVWRLKRQLALREAGFLLRKYFCIRNPCGLSIVPIQKKMHSTFWWRTWGENVMYDSDKRTLTKSFTVFWTQPVSTRCLLDSGALSRSARLLLMRF
jgi:hypothetical protein